MSELDQLLRAVHNSSKYQQVNADFVRRLGQIELDKRRNLKAAIKATKNKLHQVAGAYLSSRMDYDQWLEALRDADNLRSQCRAIMEAHASTRERLPILDEFYSTILADLGPIHSVIDVACGLNPLTIPWMPLAPDATYWAYDIYDDLMHFVDNLLQILDVNGHGYAQDISRPVPSQAAQVALVLKTLPVLEQIEKGAAVRLLENIQADHIVVSFPIASLTGKHKDMATHYETQLRDWLVGKAWRVHRWEMATELTFRLDT